jgi:hypothetical protein
MQQTAFLQQQQKQQRQKLPGRGTQKKGGKPSVTPKIRKVGKFT